MVLDKRAEELAKIVVDYSLQIQETDTLLIRSEPDFKEFADYISKLAQDKGANILHIWKDLDEFKALIERNDKKELKKVSKHFCSLAEQSTAEVGIDATADPTYLSGMDPKKIADFAKIVKSPFAERICGDGKKFKGIKWLWAAYPCIGYAKEAEMSLEEHADFVFSATNIDWQSKKKEMERVKALFDDAKDVHIIADKTDLHFSLKGRGGCICAGQNNMPDGEVYYGPVEDSANGIIHFPYTSIQDSNRISGITLTYKNGKVVDFDAHENKSFLESMLALDGVKRIGEFGIGCNYGIKNYTNNLLFDEKIGGTIHLALGESLFEPLDQGGGRNQADIHWDLVCDLRKNSLKAGGEIYVDGRLVHKDGVLIK